MRQYKKYRKLTFSLLIGLLFFNCCDLPPDRRVVIIFCDVTGSLRSDENNKVKELVVKLMKSLEEKTSFAIYPIHASSDSSAPILEGEINDPDMSAKLIAQINGLPGELEKLGKDIGTMGAADQRTCILSTLKLARDVFRNKCAEAKKCNLELFYISDMLEDCVTTPFNKPVSLDKPDISPELNNANNFPLEQNKIPYSKVTIIFPVTPVQSNTNSKPKREDIKEYWKVIFERAGVIGKDFQTLNGILPPEYTKE